MSTGFVRSKYDRAEAATRKRLSKVLAAGPLRAHRTVQLGRRGSNQNGAKQRRVHPPRHERDAELTIRAAKVSVERPACIERLG